MTVPAPISSGYAAPAPDQGHTRARPGDPSFADLLSGSETQEQEDDDDAGMAPIAASAVQAILPPPPPLTMPEPEAAPGGAGGENRREGAGATASPTAAEALPAVSHFAFGLRFAAPAPQGPDTQTAPLTPEPRPAPPADALAATAQHAGSDTQPSRPPNASATQLSRQGDAAALRGDLAAAALEAGFIAAPPRPPAATPDASAAQPHPQDAGRDLPRDLTATALDTLSAAGPSRPPAAPPNTPDARSGAIAAASLDPVSAGSRTPAVAADRTGSDALPVSGRTRTAAVEPPASPTSLTRPPAPPPGGPIGADGNSTPFDSPDEGRSPEGGSPADRRRLEPGRMAAPRESETAGGGHSQGRSSAPAPEPPRRSGDRAPGDAFNETSVAPPLRAPTPASAAQPHNAAAAPTRSEPLPPEAVQAARPVRDLSLRLEGPERIELKLTERGGSVQVAVRTADPELAGVLRRDLGELSSRLDAAGIRAESWQPESARATRGDSGAEPNRHGQPHEQPQQGRQSRHRQDKEPGPGERDRKDFSWFVSTQS